MGKGFDGERGVVGEDVAECEGAQELNVLLRGGSKFVDVGLELFEEPGVEFLSSGLEFVTQATPTLVDPVPLVEPASSTSGVETR